jgi:DNA-binding GntR family transcriptional regulator
MEVRAPERSEHWRELNYRFHMDIYHAAKMERLERIITPLFASVEGYLRLYVGTVRSMEGPQREHRELLAALRRGDGKEASRITAHHLSATMEGLLEVLDGDDIKAPARRPLGEARND